MKHHVVIAPELIFILNQVFEIEQKVDKLKETNSIQRNISRLKDKFEEMRLVYHNPLGERFNETRTDCEASISGNSTENLVIKEVIKPIIRLKDGKVTTIVQKAVVVVESQLKTDEA